MCLVSVVLAFGETESPLEKAEALMTEGKFYEALFALEPLLTAEGKNADQEEALWLANALCRTWVNSNDFYERWEKTKQEKNKPEFMYANGFMQWDKVILLNQWHAEIGYEHFNARPDYQYGFLKRLVTLYPESSWRPAAEYYLIKHGYNEREPVEKSLNAHYDYIKKYAKSGLTEIYMAYLHIAHVNDNLWQALKSLGESEHYIGFTSGNTQKDKADAERHKAEALKYYAKFIVSVSGKEYKGIFSHQYRETLERYENLKQNKEWNSWFIILD
jgi:hypothetical protein